MIWALLLSLVLAADARERALRPIICREGLDRIALYDAALGAEAARIKPELSQDCSLEGREVSHAMKLALRRMNDYFRLSSGRPSAKVLRKALLSPAGVAEVAAVYERMIASPVRLKHKRLLLELGGEATLGKGIMLHELVDPRRRVMKLASELGPDALALERLYTDDADPMAMLDEHGLLKSALARNKEWRERGSPPSAERERLLRLALDATLEAASGRYFHTPKAQLEAMIRDEWSGQLLGHWHAHPPHLGVRAFEPGALPSDDDREVAAADGFNLTLVFQPDGFDAYDAGAALAPVASYRSRDWKERFDSLFLSLMSAP